MTMKPWAGSMLAAAVLLTSPLAAQQGEVEPAPDGGVATSLPLRPQGSRLTPHALLYDVLVTSDSGTQHVGWHTVWIYDVSFAGNPAWEISERRESHAPFAVRVASDSVIVSRERLVPLRWEAASGDARFVAAFSNDSAYGGATSPSGRSTFTVPAPGPVITSEGSLEAALKAAPLVTGWSASAIMLVADMGGGRLESLHLSVTGDETVAVPAGSFDTWIVRAAAPGSERTLWLDKATHRVVKTSQSPPHMPGMTVERVLVGGR